MKQNATYFKVGLFVLVCAAGLVAGLVYIGADMLHGEAVLVETYIDESVQGLSIGSPVNHRGVNIGQVERITFVQAEYPMKPDSEEFKKFGRYVMVVMALDPRRFPGLDRNPAMVTAMLRNQVSLGLRFKLSYLGITGMAYMEADYVTDIDKYPELQVPWVPQHIYISSMPSLLTSFTAAVQSVFDKLEKIPFEDLINRFDATLLDIQTTLREADIAAVSKAALETLDTVKGAVHDADIKQIRTAAVAMLEEFKKTSEGINSLFAETDEPMPGNLRSALTTFSQTLDRVDQLLDRHEMDIDAVIANLKILAQNLRQVSDTIKDNPSRVLFEAPPGKSERVQ